MKTFYCVTTTVTDYRVSANITRTPEAEEIPENSYTSTSRRDIYNDWFETIEEAKQFVEMAKKA